MPVARPASFVAAFLVIMAMTAVRAEDPERYIPVAAGPPGPAATSKAPVPAAPPGPDYVSMDPLSAAQVPDDAESGMEAVLTLVIVTSHVPSATQSFWPVTMSMKECRARMEPEIRHFLAASGMGAPNIAVAHYHDAARAATDYGIVHADCRAAR